MLTRAAVSRALEFGLVELVDTEHTHKKGEDSKRVSCFDT
jgi:hypothetical protein